MYVDPQTTEDLEELIIRQTCRFSAGSKPIFLNAHSAAQSSSPARPKSSGSRGATRRTVRADLPAEPAAWALQNKSIGEGQEELMIHQFDLAVFG